MDEINARYMYYVEMASWVRGKSGSCMSKIYN